jgi:hypothetical protein
MIDRRYCLVCECIANAYDFALLHIQTANRAVGTVAAADGRVRAVCGVRSVLSRRYLK